MLRLLLPFALCAFAITPLTCGATHANESPTYSDPEQAYEEIITPLIANDRPRFLRSMTYHFSEQGSQIDALVFDSFLSEGETFDYYDRLQSDALGETFKRTLYVLRTSTNDFLFVRISMVKGLGGWIAYDLDIKSELERFLPGWDSP